MIRPIVISLSPNLENTDVLCALKLLFSPLQFLNGDAIKSLEQWFRHFFSVSYAISFVSGRGALYAVLKSLGLQTGDEVLLQAFTCVAVPNAVIATGAMPVYIDIDDSLNIDIEEIKKKITKKTKVIIAQHTFGIPANIKELVMIAKKNKILLVEDCAYIIGGDCQRKKLGTFGIAAIFSFGRDKAFSSVFGGMAITDDEVLGNKIRHYQKQQGYPGFFWIAQQLFHPVASFFILPLYNTFSIGKALLFFLQKIKFLGFPVLPEEKEGKTNPVFVKKLPNALAALALHQLRRLKEINAHRQQLTRFYKQQFHNTKALLETGDGPLLRFPFLVKNKISILKLFRKKGIYLGSWYNSPVDPNGVILEKVFYKKGMCPKVEVAVEHIINLPTYPTMTISDAKKVTDLIKKYA